MPCILIVDDDEDTREALRAILRDEGFDARVAKDGEEAIVQITTQDAPSLVLLDTRLPKADGLQVLDAVEKRHELDSIPVVLVTGDSKPIGHRRAVAVLRKPYDLDDILRLARKFCGGK